MLKLYSVIRPSDQSSYSFANLRSTSVLRFSTLVSSALCLLALAASSCSLPFSSRCRSSVSSCANRDASRPYWKPRAKGLHPSGHPHIFLANGTHIEKTAFSHVRTFLKKWHSTRFLFCIKYAKKPICAVKCDEKFSRLPTQHFTSSHYCGRNPKK